MSCNYAEGLSPYHDKGQLGLQERFDNPSVITAKVDMLAKWINKAKHVVFHTGAGISTSAGIPDFRGPRGVWTLQAKGQKPDLSKDFNEAAPTPAHMAIARLVESSKVKYVISQNIDGLHLRSGVPRKYLSELHGNMFIEQCNSCNRQFVRNKAVPTVGQKSLSKACPTVKPNGRACRGRLHDCILDWEHSLPENDLAMADFNSCMADLSIAIGTTMQIVPSGTLPLYTKRAGGKLVIINLQPTKHDTKADLLVHGYADEVMTKLMKQLSLRIPKYTTSNDPTRLSLTSDRYFDWTITDATTAQMRKVYEAKCGNDPKKRLLQVIDEDDIPLNTRIEKTSKKRKSDEGGSSKKKSKKDDDDSDLEVVEEIPRKTRGRPKKITTEVRTPTKLTIKKNVTSTQTKYEIVKDVKKPKIDVEIVHASAQDPDADLEMLCESDDEGPIVFTTNFKRYLHDDKTFKREEKEKADSSLDSSAPPKAENENTNAVNDVKTDSDSTADPESKAKEEVKESDKKDDTGSLEMANTKSDSEASAKAESAGKENVINPSVQTDNPEEKKETSLDDKEKDNDATPEAKNDECILETASLNEKTAGEEMDKNDTASESNKTNQDQSVPSIADDAADEPGDDGPSNKSEKLSEDSVSTEQENDGNNNRAAETIEENRVSPEEVEETRAEPVTGPESLPCNTSTPETKENECSVEGEGHTQVPSSGSGVSDDSTPSTMCSTDATGVSVSDPSQSQPISDIDELLSAALPD